MIKLSSLLKENRSKEITKEQLHNILSEKCLDFIKWHLTNEKQLIYRGLESSSNILLIEPSKHVRKSRNASNYYTEIIDNSPRWSAFPKRSKSIVCTTDYNKASKYGNIYVVIPYDNAIFGICPLGDIWNSFENSIAKYIGHFVMIPQVMGTIFSLVEVITNDSTYGDDIESIKKASEFINTNKDLYNWDSDEHILKFGHYGLDRKVFKFISEYVKSGRTLMDALEDLLDPELNDFKVLKYPGQIVKQVEVWTDSNCILVEYEYFKMLNINNIFGKRYNSTEV